MPKIHGPTVDHQTRCVHYQSAKDITAIKFKCCGKYYPCYRCHNECEDHSITVWNEGEFDEYAIICGVCGKEHTINQYLKISYCIHCRSPFNPGCKLHHHHYFQSSF